jgi:hypothetical protein
MPQQFNTPKPLCLQWLLFGIWLAPCLAEIHRTTERRVKIDRSQKGQKTAIRLIGHFHLDHLAELRKQVEENAEAMLDLSEVTVVDVDVVRFLAECKEKGRKIVHCPRYLRRWMLRETRD